MSASPRLRRDDPSLNDRVKTESPGTKKCHYQRQHPQRKVQLVTRRVWTSN